MQMIKLANTIVMEIVKIKLFPLPHPTSFKEEATSLGFVAEGCDGLRVALEENTEPRSSHLSIWRAFIH